ncbi:MAG: UDP-2,3-diacylglucosamine diphosphatase [Tannerellaceae bacterium]|jgi:UDP-2,3-diacylglucosamine hydrolase|nr:UDP-2,3-diacylglucosamine diphosphatase [Tannerellaceae bacterium]
MAEKPGKVYFLADAHLGARFHVDSLAVERRLVRWLDRIQASAAAIYFLGDMFDYWYEYKYVVPKGFVRFLGKLAEMADAGVEIHLFTGNHDVWLFDYLSRETGAVIHRQPLTTDLLGKRFFLAHGDEVGYQDVSYRFLRAMFRNRFCQRLYAAVHPRWTFGFALRWSLSSRRDGLTSEKGERYRRIAAERLADFARSYLQHHPQIDFFIFGHLHRMLDLDLGHGARLLIAGDWMQYFSFIEWDGQTLALRSLSDPDA